LATEEKCTMRRWDGLVDRYLEEYEARGRAVGTIDGLRRELDRCGTWLKNRRPRPRLDDVDSDLLIDYVRSRTAFHAKATLSSVMSKLRGFGEFLTREGIWKSNPLRWMRGPKLDSRSRLPRRISGPAMTQLWDAAATSRIDYSRTLWLTLLSVFYGTGARRGEVARLDVAHWDRDTGLLQFDGRKTSWERRVPLAPLVQECLEAYLPRRQNHLEALGRRDEAALFVNKHGARLSLNAISRGMKSIARRCDLEHVTLHQLRHTCASDLLEAGAHLREVQCLLGHQVIGTTMRYLHIADPQLHEAVRNHPINMMLKKEGRGHE
jgi:site-specific recombinase XerD